MKTTRFAPVAALLAMSSPALAAEDAAPSDTSFRVGEIVVTARSMAGSAKNVITSVDIMGADVAQRASVNYAWELIGRMPGVLVTNFNQGTTSGKVSLRGFNGEGEVNAVKLLIDGVPANSNDGNMPFLDMVFPLEIAGIEVVRGTSDPRYGLNAIGGSVNIATRTGGTYADARASAGNFGTYEGQLAAGLERGALSQNYSVAYRQADGYRAHGAVDRTSLAGKWTLTLSPALRVGASARYYKGNAQEPGYLTFADSRADPSMTNAYNASDGDVREMQQYALHVDGELGSHLGVTARAYVNKLDDDRFVKFSAGASQQRRVTHETQYGVMAALHAHGTVAGMAVMGEVGGDMQWQDNRSLRYLTANRTVTTQTRDQAFTLDVGGVYAQAVLQPAAWLKITPAWRIDRVGGHFRNQLNGTAAPINDYGTISQPKLSVAVTPVDRVTLYANWGRTFQIGLGSGAYLIPPRTTDLAPSINTGWEAGIKFVPMAGSELRVALWRQTATGEIKRKLNDPLGDSENLGSTRRRGVDVQASARPVTGLSLWGALSWQDAVVIRPDPATPQYAGNQIDHVPHWLWSAGVDATMVPRLRLSAWANGQSSYWLTAANSPAQGKFGRSAVFNAEAAYQLTPQVELAVTGRNLTDQYYEYAWWDGAQSLHSPAEGRGVTGSVRLRF